jgi:hypothetical protein
MGMLRVKSSRFYRGLVNEKELNKTLGVEDNTTSGGKLQLLFKTGKMPD